VIRFHLRRGLKKAGFEVPWTVLKKIPLLSTQIILDNEETHKNPQADYLVTRSTFEPGDAPL
jgi:hypothetical protein